MYDETPTRYTGPGTEWTGEHDIYHAAIGVPLSPEDFAEGDTALGRAIERVRVAVKGTGAVLVRQGSPAQSRHKWTPRMSAVPATRSRAMVDVLFRANDDDHARRIFGQVAIEVDAKGGVLAYCEPTEQGWAGRRVARLEATSSTVGP